MKSLRAWLVAMLAILPVVTTGSNYRLSTSPAMAATVSVKDLAVGSVINVGGMNYVKINSNNVLAATSSFACPNGEWIAGQYVRCFDQEWIAGKDVRCFKSDWTEATPAQTYQVYGCQAPIATMQTWDDCGSLATPAIGSYTQGPCLVDARDGKTYEVRKYADGLCWMVDNLAYGGDTALGQKDGCLFRTKAGNDHPFGSLDSAWANSNVPEYQTYDFTEDTLYTGKILTGTFGEGTYGNCAKSYNGDYYKQFQTFEPDGYSTQNPDYDTYAEALAAVQTANPTLNLTQAANLVRPRGYHYDWIAATQNPTAYHKSNNPSPYTGASHVQGICPYGWRLPTGGNNGEFRGLFQALGGAASGNGGSNSESAVAMNQIIRRLWKASISGWSAGGTSSSWYLNWCALWHSSSEDAANRLYNFMISGHTEGTFPEHMNGKYEGFSIRCVKD